jgi:hypothetical protein
MFLASPSKSYTLKENPKCNIDPLSPRELKKVNPILEKDNR